MKRSDMFDAFDTQTGKYGLRKVPQWSRNRRDIMEYLNAAEDEMSRDED